MLLLRNLCKAALQMLFRSCVQCIGHRASCATLCVVLFALQDHLLPAAVPADEWGVVSRQFSFSARLESKSDQGFSQNRP